MAQQRDNPFSFAGQIIGCLLVLGLLLAPVVWGAPSRIKDIATIQGQGRHKLVGYGLVAGLQGTGDSDNSLVTAQSIANMLQKLGLQISPADLKAKNIAAVIVTAELPAVAVVGSTVDVLVSSLADAKSLQGGTLLLTPLCGLDGQIYAMAQGPVTIGGFNAETSGGDKMQKNHPTVGRVPNGASVVRALAAPLDEAAALTLLLFQPDFTTAVRIAEAINRAEGQRLATAINQSTVQVTVPAEARTNLAEFVMQLENLTVEPDAPARVVINERTGTVVMGRDVRIMPVAICHGGLTVEVKTQWQVSQPSPRVQVEIHSSQTPDRGAAPPTTQPPGAPAAQSQAAGAAAGPEVSSPAQVGSPTPTRAEQSPSPAPVTGPGNVPAAPVVVDPTGRRPGAPIGRGGQTVVVPQEELKVRESGGTVRALPEQATLQDLVTALEALGVKPRDLIAIIQALKEAGALQAELILL